MQNRLKNIYVREDYSTYHTYYMNVDTGEPIKGVTAQGYSDNSAWARGQAWGVYGFALSYAHTGILACGLLELSKHLQVLDPRKKEYEETAVQIVKSLFENYTTEKDLSNGISNMEYMQFHSMLESMNVVSGETIFMWKH